MGSIAGIPYCTAYLVKVLNEVFLIPFASLISVGMFVCCRFANVYLLSSRFMVSVSTTQYNSLKVMHKKVLNLEFCRIDVYTFFLHFGQSTTCTLYIATVTLQRSNIIKTVRFYQYTILVYVDGTENRMGHLYCLYWQVIESSEIFPFLFLCNRNSDQWLQFACMIIPG